MHARTAIASLVVAVALTAPAAAQHSHDHGTPAKAAAPAQAPSAKSAMAEGEVRKVDRVKGTVTLKHGPLEALGMGPMTMPFVARDPKVLAGVKEGDRVRFEAGQTKDGTLTVGRIEVVK